MLEDMTPEEFDERWAHYRVEPWGDWFRWFAILFAMVHNGIVNIIAALTGTPANDDLFKTEADFMPHQGEKPAKAKKRRLTAQEAEHLDRMRYRRG